MASKAILTHNSFVRDLPFTLKNWLAGNLDPLDTWENLAAQIPLNYEDLLNPIPGPFEAMYASGNFMSFKRQPSPTISFLEDWGVENCRIKHLVQALLNAKLFDAANRISNQCAEEQPEPQQQGIGPSQNEGQPQQVEDTEPRVNVSSVHRTKSPKACLEDAPPDGVVVKEPLRGAGAAEDSPSSNGNEDTPIHQMPVFSYQQLERITGQFDTRDKTKGGNLIGTGGFGDVFFGDFLGNKLAVKRLKGNNEESLKQFRTEVETLCTYKHENLVTLLGYCFDCSQGQTPCLVYEYVVNGSLEDRLACLNGTAALTVLQRLDIAIGTARGLEYLHDKGVTHRDIKSANILLDENYKPKVSDFATARVLPQPEEFDPKTQVLVTTSLIGTPNYLDPEAYSYQVQPCLDIYSFGVVILELITGLPVSADNRKNKDLKCYVREYCTPAERNDDDSDDDDDDEDHNDDENDVGTIHDLVDKGPGVVWKPELVEKLYALSNKCLERQANRKKIRYVLKKLTTLFNDHCEDGGHLPED